MKIPDEIHVGAILLKLPSTWNEYRRKILCFLETYTIKMFITHQQIKCKCGTKDGMILGSKVNHVSASQNVGASSSILKTVSN